MLTATESQMIKLNNYMTLADIEDFHNDTLKAKKEKRKSITQTLFEQGVSKTTYYRMINDNGLPLWSKLRKNKIVTKPLKRTIKVHKVDMGMSGGGLSEPKLNENDFVRDMTLKLEHCNQHRKKYDEMYIDD